MTDVPGSSPSLTSDAKARVAFLRFGLGPKPGGRARIGSSQHAAYMACLKELNSAAAVHINDSQVVVNSSNGSVFPATIANCGKIAANPLSGDFNLEVLQAEATARYVKYLEPEVGFVERLVQFWNNHFSVYNGKARATVGNMERQAIRMNVLGKFSDMLIAVTTHPAMITFLDNNSSFGPTSPNGMARKVSYNENLAREILELHTLGVNGGYTQQDVTEFAKILTGWHVGFHGSANAGQFQYVPKSHEGGAFTVLGKSYPPTTGPEQGLAVLRDLAAHPKTAEHIAYKLIHHFITDTPSDVDVASLAAVFTSTNGDLHAVSKALLELPAAWTEPFNRLSQPYLWMVSITRGLGMNAAQMIANRWRYDVFASFMGQLPWWRVTPDGWPDDNYVWMTPDAVRLRSDIAYRVVVTCFNAIKWPGARPPNLAKDLLGGILSNSAAAEISAWAARDDRVALSLLFATPEYLRR